MSDNYFFDRQATVRIGKSSQTGFLASGLRVEFSITKNTKFETNKCSISIYNLSKMYRSKITVNDGMIVELMVGYSNSAYLDLIFLGDVIGVKFDDTNPDTIVQLELDDGGTLIRKNIISISLKENSTLRDVFNLIISKGIGNFQKKILDNIPNITLKNGIAFAGYFSDLLNDLCRAYNLEWSVQNGIFQVNQRNKFLSTSPISIRALQTPVRIHKNNKDEEDDSNFNGYEMKCLLQAKVVPGGVISWNNAQYTVMSVKHSGDTHGNTWESLITVKDI